MSDEHQNGKLAVEGAEKNKSLSSMLPSSLTLPQLPCPPLLEVAKSVIPPKLHGSMDVVTKHFEEIGRSLCLPKIVLADPGIDAIRKIKEENERAIARSAKIIAAATKPLMDFAEFSESISKSFAPYFREIAQIYSDINVEDLREAHRIWGGFGWMVYFDMDYESVRDVPANQIEVDARCLSRYDNESLKRLFARLGRACRRRKDLDEAVGLFKERRYKPCAMMLFSLIDNELIAIGGKAQGSSRRGSRQTVGKLRKLNPSYDLFLALMLENFAAAIDTFYRNGGDFDRDREGEVNRNFLMHGMMYKPVRRKHCIKLFEVLDTAAEMLPLLVRA